MPPNNPLVPDVIRPQYVATPDLLVVALANRAYDVQLPDGGHRVYRNLGSTSRGRGKLETAPDGSGFSYTDQQARLEQWGEYLRDAGITGDGIPQKVVGAAIARSIERPPLGKATTSSAVPFSPHTALLQEPKGLVGDNAPPYAKTVEQLFSLGQHDGSVRKSATELWSQAMDWRREGDLLVRVIDEATLLLLGGEEKVKLQSAEGVKGGKSWAMDAVKDAPGLGSLIRESDATPMHWLNWAWQEVTKRYWVERLPARRWVDWASAVLRLGFGMGLLWESRYFTKLKDIVLREELPTVNDLKRAVDSRSDLLHWYDSTLAVSYRAESVRPALQEGLRARQWFEGWFKACPAEEGVGPVEALVALQVNEEAREQLERRMGLTGTPEGDSNLQEAVAYSLGDRTKRDGGSPDLYGLMRTHGKYRIVQPGPELMVMLASLVAGEQETTTVGEVMGKLELLGIKCTLAAVLAEVEQSGLAEMSADAEIAVTIKGAF